MKDIIEAIVCMILILVVFVSCDGRCFCIKDETTGSGRTIQLFPKA